VHERTPINPKIDEVANLKRKRQPLPDFVQEALEQEGLVEDYLARPDYQQNDYVWWINDARRDETKQKRLRQMLDELHKGGIYMNMDHPPSRKN
jgi:uncharacterized protein YdeI (YjbR/CyaY-like superfamily)